MKTVSVIPNKIKDKDFRVLRSVVRILEKQVKVLVDIGSCGRIDGLRAAQRRGAELYKRADCIIGLGGDGTLLSIAPKASLYDKPMFGVNLGRVGFLSSVEVDTFEEKWKQIMRGEYRIESRMMLETDYQSRKRTALNDVVITRESFSRMIELQIHVDGIMVDSYMADGIIIATPTGSTAYSLSAGGPVVHPNMDTILITPICPHDLYARPIVLPADRTVSIKIGNTYRYTAKITVDGRRDRVMTCGDELFVTRAQSSCKLIKVDGKSFYDIVREKIAGK
ncbi:MAG: NAD(+)/NADH kinase [Clostridia bacterium]|nr:NAD(+)/NADH kinase [Clostridia bacterium]